jgi:hypothetical protein
VSARMPLFENLTATSLGCGGTRRRAVLWLSAYLV